MRPTRGRVASFAAFAALSALQKPWHLVVSQYTDLRRSSRRRTCSMTYVIAEPCIGTKDTACVDACPVDCIHPKKDSDKYAAEEMLYIDPVECIDCGACVPVCPVSAIFPKSGRNTPSVTLSTSAASSSA